MEIKWIRGLRQDRSGEMENADQEVEMVKVAVVKEKKRKRGGYG